MNLLEQTQDYNPLTWDIQLNPAAWWLSLKDINSAASVELKSSIYAGNANFTADQYREVQSLVADKYSAIDVSGIIAPGAITKDWEIAGGIDMTWKDPGLYMSNDRLWFYDGTAWQVWIGNNGDFFFGGDANNYIEWSGSVLTVKWDIEVADGSITAPKLAASLVYAWEIVIDTSGEIRSGQTAYDTGTWFWLWDVAWVKKFSIGNGTKWLKWDGSDLTIRGNIYAESGTFTWAISSTATLTIWSAWHIKSGQTAYNTGSGFWIWDDAGTKKFSIGNWTTNKLTWDGTTLTVLWNITASAATFWYLAPWSAASDINTNATTISGWKITAYSIDAARLNVWTLSAISADLWSISAGSISWVTISSSWATNKIVLSSGNSIDFYYAWANVGWLYTWESGIYVSGAMNFTANTNFSAILNVNGRLKLPVWSNLY